MVLTLWPLLLPVAALSGWLVGHRVNPKSRRQTEVLNKLSREYYVGLNYLLNEQPDKAVDVFLKLIEIDNETVETHLALGSLFRRRGQVDRAIRIHQNLIARPQLSGQQRIDALMALGRDYMSAGVLDRAERIFDEVVQLGGEQTTSSLQYLMDIYQQEKAWENAIKTVQKLEAVTGEGYHDVIAQHYCECVEEALNMQRYELAKQYLKKAISVDRDSVRASLLQARIAMIEGRYKAAIKAYKQVQTQDPDFISEMVPPLMDCYERIGEINEGMDYLGDLMRAYPRISVILVIADYIKQQQGVEVATDFLAEQLRRNPSLRGLNQLIQWHIESTYGKVRDRLEMLKAITNRLLADKPIYRCGICGFDSKTLHWYCPSCKKWNTTKPIHGLVGD